MDTDLDLLEARLEQHVFKEINRNTLEIDKDIQHVEERLEQVIFREILRLKNALLAQKEEEEEAALQSNLSPLHLSLTDPKTDDLMFSPLIPPPRNPVSQTKGGF
jgi:hypothetical protein